MLQSRRANARRFAGPFRDHHRTPLRRLCRHRDRCRRLSAPFRDGPHRFDLADGTLHRAGGPACHIQQFCVCGPLAAGFKGPPRGSRSIVSPVHLHGRPIADPADWAIGRHRYLCRHSSDPPRRGRDPCSPAASSGRDRSGTTRSLATHLTASAARSRVRGGAAYGYAAFAITSMPTSRIDRCFDGMRAESPRLARPTRRPSVDPDYPLRWSEFSAFLWRSLPAARKRRARRGEMRSPDASRGISSFLYIRLDRAALSVQKAAPRGLFWAVQATFRGHHMARQSYFFTSESVAEGHPDKVCDRISDEIVDLVFKRGQEDRHGPERRCASPARRWRPPTAS